MDKKTEVKQKIDELVEKLNYHSHQYYVLDNPEIDDYEYDKLLHTLIDLEKQHPDLVRDDSPTIRVGGEAMNTFEKVVHAVKMGSLQDVFDISELYDFDTRVREKIKNPTFVVEPKIDGLSVSLEYHDGLLTTGSTRGDGLVGEDVTENIKTIRSIPLKLNQNISLIEVRGEVFMQHKSFNELVKRQEDNFEQPFKNPRNAAAGSLRQKDPKITATRNLDIFVFNIQRVEGADITEHKASLDFLKELGFKTIPSYKTFDNIKGVIKEIERIGENRYNLPFDLDGAVVKVNNFADRELLGETAKTPKWAVAFKYPPEEKETSLLDIEINVGRTGALTPTAVFEPITLAGTTVSRAVLHNQDFINEKQIAIGDKIIVRKAGDIIPEVVSVAQHMGGETYKIPDICPVCGEKTEQDVGQAAIRCTNPNCPALVLRNIIHFATRDAMDIDGLGEAVSEALVSNNLIKTTADLYKLTADDISSLDRMGKKSANNLIKAIEKSKSQPLGRFIFALGIRNIGQKAANELAYKFKSIEALKNAEICDIMEIDGFGEIMAESVYNYFKEPSSQKLIDEFKSYGLQMKYEETKASDILAGKTFVLTGTLPTMSRTDASKLITDNGGKVSSSVSSKTSYVLAGEDDGRKLKKAQHKNIPIITEQEFLKLIEV
ncbi:MAG: NAD-dependent DNA ligase LigA [Oscillospiraceae bacterium]|nr:NAD-dependent DNA ligase LigA [Oscillospiraceae bacterium]